MKALDLFCGAGGASMGLHRAGYDVTGVDLAPQKHYPFTFHQADALTFPLEGYDLIWASPPCQRYSAMSSCRPGYNRADLIAAIRARLREAGADYIIENVPGAPLENWVSLCGAQFGLHVYRHRLFESNRLLLTPPHLPHRDSTPKAGRGASPKGFICVTAKCGEINASRAAMGIDWMPGRSLGESIPPAYSEYLARQISTDNLNSRY